MGSNDIEWGELFRWKEEESRINPSLTSAAEMMSEYVDHEIPVYSMKCMILLRYHFQVRDDGEVFLQDPKPRLMDAIEYENPYSRE